MKALSVRQPWAWLILFGGKDIENRDWRIAYRGPLLIHASKRMTREEYDDAAALAWRLGRVHLPLRDGLDRGAIIGQVEVVDCVERHDSPWFFGKYGFVLQHPQPYTPIPWPGFLGTFDVPEDLRAFLHPMEAS